MKKIAAAFIVAGIGLFATIPAAFASHSANNQFELPNGTHVKTDICHNVDHNPHIVPVSINSVKGSQETGHGLLTLGDNISFVSFVPHVGTGGHAHDFIVRVYTKKGNVEVNTYVSERKCGVEETTTTTQPTTTTTQPTTTTTVPVVTTTTQPVVTTTTNPTNVVCPDGSVLGLGVSADKCLVVTTTSSPVVTTTTETPNVPVTTVTPTVGTLPHTGSWSLIMALIGGAAALLGIGLALMGNALKRAEN